MCLYWNSVAQFLLCFFEIWGKVENIVNEGIFLTSFD